MVKYCWILIVMYYEFLIRLTLKLTTSFPNPWDISTQPPNTPSPAPSAPRRALSEISRSNCSNSTCSQRSLRGSPRELQPNRYVKSWQNCWEKSGSFRIIRKIFRIPTCSKMTLWENRFAMAIPKSMASSWSLNNGNSPSVALSRIYHGPDANSQETTSNLSEYIKFSRGTSRKMWIQPFLKKGNEILTVQKFQEKKEQYPKISSTSLWSKKISSMNPKCPCIRPSIERLKTIRTAWGARQRQYNVCGIYKYTHIYT